MTFILNGSTPAHYNTPEVTKHVNFLLDEIHRARGAFESLATLFIRAYGENTKRALDAQGDQDISESFAELQESFENINKIHHEFMQAATGQTTYPFKREANIVIEE